MIKKKIEERFAEVVKDIVAQNEELAMATARVVSFYRGNADLPRREERLETLLDPKRNGANAKFEALKSSLKEFARGEYPMAELEKLFNTSLKLVQDDLESVHRGKSLHDLASHMVDFYRYLISPNVISKEEHWAKIDEYMDEWSEKCAENAADFYHLTTIKIEERKRKKLNRKPRVLSYFSNKNLAVLFRVHENTISNWKRAIVAVPPGFMEAIKLQANEMIRAVAEQYRASHYEKADAMNRKNIVRNLSEEEIYKLRGKKAIGDR